MVAVLWHSAFKPSFDAIVERDPPPSAAVEMMLGFQRDHGLSTPRFYVSTAISSAGWKRHPDLRSKAGTGEAIGRNNATASRVLDTLIESTNNFVTAQTMMVPTDLGKVDSWKDTDYLMFYFAWLAGLNAEGAEHFVSSFNDGEYVQIFQSANDRGLTNAQRWPWYQQFTEIALTKLRLTEALPNMQTGDEATTLLQLVDVGESLGCRAERIFADARGLDIIIPTFAEQLAEELESDVGQLRELGAVVGATRTQIELIPVALR